MPIVPGFIGGTCDGRVTTLGRGGSDYSAVALGVALQAARVELCKAEVDGVYEADPHTNGHARRFETLTYTEALRLSRSGAKVLQEKAAALAGRWAIPVLVRPAFAEGRGTMIGSRSEQFRAMPLPGKAVTAEAALGGCTKLMCPDSSSRLGVRPFATEHRLS